MQPFWRTEQRSDYQFIKLRPDNRACPVRTIAWITFQFSLPFGNRYVETAPTGPQNPGAGGTERKRLSSTGDKSGSRMCAFGDMVTTGSPGRTYQLCWRRAISHEIN